MLEIIKTFIAKHNSKKILFSLIVSFLLMLFVLYNFVEMSSFVVTLLKAVIGIALYWWIDEYLLSHVNTLEELKKGNLAYALFLLGLAVIIASAIIGS